MVLRDPSLNGFSRETLFREFDRRIAIDENVFFIDALMHARQSDALEITKKLGAQPKPGKNLSSSSSTFVTRCFAYLAYELKPSTSQCKSINCRFFHPKLLVPLPVAEKRDLIATFVNINSEEFKKRMTDAVNALRSV